MKLDKHSNRKWYTSNDN